MTKQQLERPPAAACHEGYMSARCPNPVAWQITTAAGQSLFCETHAKWYLNRGTSIYPAIRVVGGIR